MRQIFAKAKLLILLIVFTQSAAQAQNCPQATPIPNWQIEDTTNLVHKVNIVGSTDDRVRLNDRNWSSYFKERILYKRLRDSTGMVYCVGANGPAASGSLFITNGQILTATHVFKDQNDNWLKPLTNCYFDSQGTPPIHAKLSLVVDKNGNPVNFKVGKLKPGQSGCDDYAIVRIQPEPGKQNPFKDVTPLSVDLVNAGGPEANDVIASVSATQDGMGDVNTDPIITTCSLQQTYKSPDCRAQNFLSDCDSKVGSSGGSNVVLHDGNLELRGITVAGGDPKFDGKPYGYTAATAKGKKVVSYMKSISIDPAVVSDGLEMAKEHGDQIPSTNSNVPSAVPTNSTQPANSTNQDLKI